MFCACKVEKAAGEAGSVAATVAAEAAEAAAAAAESRYQMLANAASSAAAGSANAVQLALDTADALAASQSAAGQASTVTALVQVWQSKVTAAQEALEVMIAAHEAEEARRVADAAAQAAAEARRDLLESEEYQTEVAEALAVEGKTKAEVQCWGLIRPQEACAQAGDGHHAPHTELQRIGLT